MKNSWADRWVSVCNRTAKIDNEIDLHGEKLNENRTHTPIEENEVKVDWKETILACRQLNDIQ